MLGKLFNKNVEKNVELSPISRKKAWFLTMWSILLQGILIVFTTFWLNGIMNRAEVLYGKDWYPACISEPMYWTVILLLVCEIVILGDYIVKDAIKLNDRVRIGEMQSKEIKEN
jgi:hypothetical protein